MGLLSRLRTLNSSKNADFSKAIDDDLQTSQPLVPEGPRLNLGCGFDIRPGWINIDLHDWHKPDMVADITDLKQVDDNFAAYALAQDILEHVHRVRCPTALQEWNRVLIPGELLEIRVPDVIALAQLMQAPDRQDPQQQATLLQCMFGTQSYTGDYHYNGFTETSLRHDLETAGFELVHLSHQDEWLFKAVARKVVHRPPESLLRMTGDDDFLDQAYRTILHREPDAGGRSHFLEKLASGIPRESILTILRAAIE